MITSKPAAIIVFFLIGFLSACSAVYSPMKSHFENNFINFSIPDNNTVKCTSIVKDYSFQYEIVWESVVSIILQNTIIVKMSKSFGYLVFVDIDGVLLEDKIVYWEFPFTVLIDREDEKTIVYVYPMNDLFQHEKKIIEKKWWKTIQMGFNQKGEELLNKLAIRLSTNDRWPWLSE